MMSFARLYYNKTFRKIAFQVIVVGGFALLCVGAYNNMVDALENRLGVAIGFDFLTKTAGFEISDKLIEYDRSSTFARAILVGLLNTLYLGFFGILLMLALGLFLALGRLSTNRLVSDCARIYISFFRNMPPVLVLVFWATIAFAPLPLVRNSIILFEDVFTIVINNRGIYLSLLIATENTWMVAALVCVLSFGVIAAYLRAKRRARITGRDPFVVWYVFAIVLFVPAISLLAVPNALDVEHPVIKRFNVDGGYPLTQQFIVALSALVMYQSAFAAEAIRTGIQSVGKGQLEAAISLGLRHSTTTRFVVLPQAMRVSIPALISNCIGFVKNSSLCVAVGYPDLFSVTANTIANQSGRAVEAYTIIMVLYLAISLSLSALLNFYESRSGKYARKSR